MSIFYIFSIVLEVLARMVKSRDIKNTKKKERNPNILICNDKILYITDLRTPTEVLQLEAGEMTESVRTVMHFQQSDGTK